MSDQSQVELRFFSGTIEIHINRTQPLHEFTWPTAVQWDPRTSCLRAPAIAYSAIVMALVRQRIPYQDHARDYLVLEGKMTKGKIPRPLLAYSKLCLTSKLFWPNL